MGDSGPINSDSDLQTMRPQLASTQPQSPQGLPDLQELRLAGTPQMIRVNLISPRSLGYTQCPITGISYIPLDLESLVSLAFQNPDKTSPPDSSADLAVNFRALPTELLLLLLRGERISERILAYLAGAESRELDPWLRDDIRIAWLCVLHCAEGISQPWEYAFWRYLGKHPDKLIPFFVERAEKHAAMEAGSGLANAGASADCELIKGSLARVPQLYQTAAEEISLPPRKPVSPVSPKEKKESA